MSLQISQIEINLKTGEKVKAINLIEVLDAAHLSRFVRSPFGPRGGIFLIGPPGTLKSTLVNCAVEGYHDARGLSDINVQQLLVLRDDIAAGRFQTLAFFAMEKLYQRHSSTAANVEGTIAALVEEGFTTASFEDQRRPSIVARCLVIGAMTDALHRSKYKEWMDSGFARRFLHCLYRLESHSALMDSVEKWQPIILSAIQRKWPSNLEIPFKVTTEESRKIRNTLKYQPGDTTPFQLCLRIYCVLKWKYNPTQAMKIFMDFSESLGDHGAILTL